MSAAAIEGILLAIALVEKLLPILKQLKPGEVSVEKQNEVKEKIAALKLRLESGDLPDHWQVPDRD